MLFKAYYYELPILSLVVIFNMNLPHIDKESFISDLWKSLHDMAFLDIKRASNGGSKMGAFILSSCFVEYLAGFYFGKETKPNDYENFIRLHFTDKYDPKKLRRDLRNKLVHNYSEGGSYLFTDAKPQFHLTISANDARTIINLENFIDELKQVLDKYFLDLRSNDVIFELAKKRHRLFGVIGIVKFT